jgi:NADH pyrophosphatase NudC (nudix superfamily)
MRAPIPLIPLSLIAVLIAVLAACEAPEPETRTESPIGIAVHGGAGTMSREDMSEEQERQYHAALAEALQAGHAILDNGGSSLDAVQAAIRVLEDSPLFNAGRGSVFTSDERIEMDAAIMDGRTLNAGALTGVRAVRNPIDLARVIMDESPHVFFSGEGAETFGAEFGLATEDPEWFETERRRDALRRAREQEEAQGSEFRSERENAEFNLGTVGAVALDRDGNLAAGPAAGGLSNKRMGPPRDPAVLWGGPPPHDRLLLGHAAHWPDGRFSTLAGYVEPGESLEQAVRREVAEETSVVVGDGPGDVEYRGSQPWPFPASLMLGFRARAIDTRVAVDGVEVTQARWFTRAEFAEAARTREIGLPGKPSIARALVEEWYGANLDELSG